MFSIPLRRRRNAVRPHRLSILAAALLAQGAIAQPAWHGSVQTEAYEVDVDVPAGGQGFSGLDDGRHHKSVAAGDLRVPQADEATAHLQFLLTASDDRAVLSRFRSQMGSLQAGHTGLRHQVLAGDVVADHSPLAPGFGLRGVRGSRVGEGWSASGYSGVVTHSWESLWRGRPVDGRPARDSHLRQVHGGSATLGSPTGLQARLKHQAWSDAAGRAAAGGLPPAQEGRVSTLGLDWRTAVGAWGQLQLSGEVGRSALRQEGAAGEVTGGASLLDAALTARSGEASVQLRAGRNDIGTGWRGMHASQTPGLREIYAAADLQPNRHLVLAVDARNTRLAPSSAAAVPYQQDTRTWRLLWQPENLPGWSISAQRTTQQATRAGAADTRTVQDSATLERSAEATTVSVGWSRLSVRYALAPYADGETLEWRASVRHTLGASALQSLGVANGQVSATLGRLTQRTAYPSGLRSNYLLLSASVAPGARTSLSADLEYRQMRDTVAAQDYRSSALSLNYQHEFAHGPTLRAFLRHNNFYRGLLAAEVRERIAGVSLGWSW